jgi:hypothetical protein
MRPAAIAAQTTAAHSSASVAAFPYARRAACLILALSLAACGGGEPTAAGGQPWQGTTVTEGNVTTVHTESGSVWQGTARLVEELSIGEEVGEEPYMLGRISAVAATDGRIYALDAQVPVVRVYDQRGTHVLDIGGGGQGPGEFERPTFMGLDRTGNVFVLGQGEIEVFSPEGTPIATWSLEELSVFAWFNTSNVGPDGTVYVPVTLEREGMNPGTWKVGYAGINEGEAGETRPLPEFDYEAPVIEIVRRNEEYVMVASISPAFVPRRAWAVSPYGSLVAGSGNQYRLQIHHADDRKMVIEKAWDQVPVENAEGDWYRDLLRADLEDVEEVSGWDPNSQLPSHKPAFEQIVPDSNGRIWVIKPGPGIRLTECNEEPGDADEYRAEPCWLDSVLIDVFDEQGRYLGPVEAPSEFYGMTPRTIQPRPFIRDDIMIAAVEDELGTIQIKRYRLVLPS